MQSVQSPNATTAIVTHAALSEQVDRKLRIDRTELPGDLNARARLGLPYRPLPFPLRLGAIFACNMEMAQTGG